MTVFNQMPAITSLSAGDQLPLYSADNGDVRRLSLSSLLTYFASTFTAPNFTTLVSAPVTGFNNLLSTPTTQTVWVLMQPAGTLATGTITFPLNTTVTDGTEILLTSTQTITALTLAGNGATIQGAATTISATAPSKYRYFRTTNIWYRV